MIIKFLKWFVHGSKNNVNAKYNISLKKLTFLNQLQINLLVLTEHKRLL